MIRENEGWRDRRETKETEETLERQEDQALLDLQGQLVQKEIRVALVLRGSREILVYLVQLVPVGLQALSVLLDLEVN